MLSRRHRKTRLPTSPKWVTLHKLAVHTASHLFSSSPLQPPRFGLCPGATTANERRTSFSRETSEQGNDARTYRALVIKAGCGPAPGSPTHGAAVSAVRLQRAPGILVLCSLAGAKGLPYPTVIAAVLVAAEVLGSIALIIGAWSRWTASVPLAFAVTALWIAHRSVVLSALMRPRQSLKFCRTLAIMGGLLLYFCSIRRAIRQKRDGSGRFRNPKSHLLDGRDLRVPSNTVVHIGCRYRALDPNWE